MKSEEEYKFLIFVFKLSGEPNDNIMTSYCNEYQLIEMGLDPTQEMDIKIDHKGHHVAFVNLQGKFKDRFSTYNRDLSIRKIFGEL